MITYRMHLLRTGATSDRPGPRYVGQSDPPLHPQGVEELACLCRDHRYPPAEMVFSSPLRRCVETAELLYPDQYLEEMDDLMDMNLGVFEDMTFDELRDNRDFAAWLENSLENPPPGGEDMMAFQGRIVRAARDIFHRMMDRRMRDVAVVTHGGVIMSLLAGIGLPKAPMQQWAAPNGMGFTLLFTPQMWMRDGCAEIFARQPEPASEYDEQEEDGL